MAPDTGQAFNQLEVFVEDDAAGTRDHFTRLLGEAEETADIALPRGADVDLAEAIVTAYEGGVEVRVVTDIDEQDEAGIVHLLDNDVPVTLADGAVGYFDFGFNQDVSWSSEKVIMSDAWAIVDGTRMVNATTAGGLHSGSRVVLQLQGEDLGWDLGLEHNQLFGGADSTSLTAYSSMQKSIVDNRWVYPTQSDLVLEVWFGPQERLTKRIIDATYSARSSVWVLTDDFANEGLTAALQAKAETGFDCKVVVGPNFTGSSTALSRFLANDTPDVDKYQITDVDRVPTVVLVDYDSGLQSMTKAFVLSHDLYAAGRLYRGSEVISDQLIDGNLMVLVDSDEPSPEIELLKQLFDDHLDRAEDL